MEDDDLCSQTCRHTASCTHLYKEERDGDDDLRDGCGEGGQHLGAAAGPEDTVDAVSSREERGVDDGEADVEADEVEAAEEARGRRHDAEHEHVLQRHTPQHDVAEFATRRLNEARVVVSHVHDKRRRT